MTPISISSYRRPIFRLGCTFFMLALVGCSGFNSGWNRYTPQYSDPYMHSDFDELLTFGETMARTLPSSRAKTCRTLLKRKASSANPGVVLHLMVGRLLSDACGDIPNLLATIRSIPPSGLRDVRLQKLVAINTETLKRMNRRSAYAGTRHRSSSSDVDTKPSKASKPGETQLLREKLEAIRSMEKQMDESSDAQ